MRHPIPLLALALSVNIVFAAERPPVVEAARNGARETLRGLIQKGANVNAGDEDGATALHWATYRDDLDSVELLLRAGAKVNAANDLGATPLWVASQNGSDAMVRRLLAAGANPNAALLLGETPLMVAARGGHASVADQLIARGARVDARAGRGQTALMWAASQKHPEVVKVLLARGASVHLRSDSWSQVMAVAPHGYLEYNRTIPHGADTALMFAVRVGDVESSRLLAAAGGNVNDKDAWGVSAVTLAAHAGFTDVVMFLLERGADPNAAEAGFTALHAAIMHRDENMVGALLAKGANPNATLQTWTPSRRSSNDFSFAPEFVGATPFWLAARFTEPGIMRMLLKYKADPRVIHKGDYVPETGAREDGFQHRTYVTTPLLAALGVGGGGAWAPPPAQNLREAIALECVRIAVDSGVDLNVANTDGRTALDAATTLKYQTIVKLLADRGAQPGKK